MMFTGNSNTTNPTPLHAANNNSPIQIAQSVVLICTLLSCLSYIFYVLARTVVSISYRTLFAKGSTLKQRYQSITQCYFCSRPIARLFFLLQVCIVIMDSSDAAMMVDDWARDKLEYSKSFCYYQAFSLHFFGIASKAWCVVIAVWTFWVLVLQRRTKYF